MIVYLSGPITGIKDGNRQLFGEANSVLNDGGYSVLNPLNNFSGRMDLPREYYMTVDIGHVLISKMVVMLPRWQGSKGCRTELQVAFETGKEVLTYRGPRQSLGVLQPFDLTDGWKARERHFDPMACAYYARGSL
jgi:hypothetical protein